MLAATEKNVAHMAMILDHAPQLSLHLITTVFENLLKLVIHHDDIPFTFGGNLRRSFQNFVQGRARTDLFADSERQDRLAFVVYRHTGSEAAKELPGNLQ